MTQIPASLTILIIDDNPDDRDHYVRLLKKNPDMVFCYHEASESKAGLDLVEDKHPDCILLDYSLPGLNGLDVLKQIKAVRTDIPVILLTGQGSEAIAVQAIKLGADDYLSKSSMTTEGLCHAIHMAMQYNYLQNKIMEQTQLLLTKERRYQQLIDGVHDYAFCWLDREGRIESWNSGAERMMGYGAEEVINRHISLFYTAEECTNEAPLKALAMAMAHKNFANEAWHVRKDGGIFWVSSQIDALFDKEGTLTGFVKITRDITERRNAERERQKLFDRLMQSNMELERFAYVASHDMQEPVRMVVNFSKILAQDFGNRLDEEGISYLTFITESGERIYHMIDDLLDYARIDGEDDGVMEINSMVEIHHVVENLGMLIQEKGAKITWDVLPTLYGNPMQFMRLMQNLVANGLKYQPPGNSPIIHIGVRDEGNEWHLSVKDNGIGIDEAFIRKIFEPFRRLHNWEEIKGTGLGLSVCKKIVESHGGKIWVESQLGQGSIFHISFPKESANRRIAA